MENTTGQDDKYARLANAFERLYQSWEGLTSERMPRALYANVLHTVCDLERELGIGPFSGHQHVPAIGVEGNQSLRRVARAFVKAESKGVADDKDEKHA